MHTQKLLSTIDDQKELIDMLVREVAHLRTENKQLSEKIHHELLSQMATTDVQCRDGLGCWLARRKLVRKPC